MTGARGSSEGLRSRSRSRNQSRSRHRSRDSSRSGSASSDASSGTRSAEGSHFEWVAGQKLNSNYRLLEPLGDGTFGRVLLAKDARRGQKVAIKVIRDVERYTESAFIEADILNEIYKADRHGASRCVSMYETFMHDERFFCLVFETLGISLYDLLKSNEYRGFWVQDIQTISRDLMQALSFLHGQLRITHTDLKPENILFDSMAPARSSAFPREAEWQKDRSSSERHAVGSYKRPASCRVKLIDFGNATREEEHHSSVINTRQYRAPEVLLCMGWDEQSDIWSTGCILMELYTGDLLFQADGDLEQLAMITRAVGKLPQSMLDDAGQSAKKSFLFHDGGKWRLSWPDRAFSYSTEKHVRNQNLLQELALPKHKVFVDFVAALLRLEPRGRLRAINAMLHPFFKTEFDD